MATPDQDILIAQLVLQMPAKRGLAIIITNDYSDCLTLSTLNGPKKDGETIRGVFDGFNIATYWKHNVRKGELELVVQQVAKLNRLPKSYESISFFFCGHGGTEGLCLQDGSTMAVGDIVSPLIPLNAREIGNIPKMFFIDACRGNETQPYVIVPRGSGPTARGTDKIPHAANLLVAFAAMTHFQAHEDNGGIWTQALMQQLQTSSYPIDSVLTEVRCALHKSYQVSGAEEYMQMPVTEMNTLQHPVLFNPNPASDKPALPLPGMYIYTYLVPRLFLSSA